MYRNRPRPAPTALRPRHGGFTLIEIMVAVAILAILAALTVFGLRKVLHGTQTSATLVTLNNLRAMMDELEKATKLERDTGHWLAQVPAPYGKNDDSSFTPDVFAVGTSSADVVSNHLVTSSTGPFSGLNLNFFRSPMRYPTVPGGDLSATSPTAAMRAPVYAVSSDLYLPHSSSDPNEVGIGSKDRMTAVGVLNLQIALRLFAATQVGRSSIAALPSGQLMVPDYWRGSASQYLPPNGSESPIAFGTAYAAGNVVKFDFDPGMTGKPRTVFFRALADNPPGPLPSVTTATGPLPAAQNGWAATTNGLQGGPPIPPEPVVLDAWHNPVLYCPASGLIGVWTGGTPGKAGSTYHVQNTARPPTAVRLVGKPMISLPDSKYTLAGPIVAPDGRPFFASAGPDGDFTTGDDNVYSFEN